MVGVFAKTSSAPSRRSKNFLDVDRAGSKSRISPAAGVQGEKPGCEAFQAVEVPEEPVEQDQPMQCPRPEPSIMEDGILWRARIVESLRRRNDILAANMKARECVVRGGSIPNPRRSHSRSMGEEQDVQTYRYSDTSELAINGAEELGCLIKNRVNELSPDLGDEPGSTLCSAAAPDPLRRRWEEDEEDQAAAGSMFTNPLFEFEPTSSSSSSSSSSPNYKSPTSFRKLSRLRISHSTSPSSRCKCELQARERKEICATCGTRTRVSHPFPWR